MADTYNPCGYLCLSVKPSWIKKKGIIQDGNFAFGEYLHTLRLASELADLRVADANPIRATTHEAG